MEKHMNWEQIETQRLSLKGISPEDMTFIFENYSKQEIKHLLGHKSEEDYIIEESKQKRGYAAYNRSFKLFLIIDKVSNEIIGRCGLHNWNEEHRRAEIGYMMEEQYRRRGFMSEAVSAIINFGFNKLNLNRIEALVGVGNTPSLRLLEKNMFRREGVVRQHILVSGKYEDSILLSKLYQEYSEEGQKE